MVWFPHIGPPDFQAAVLRENRPVVLAYIRFDDSFASVMETLGHIRLTFGESLALRLLDAEEHGAFGQQLGLSGTPTFVLYQNGEECLRLLGRVDRQVLEDALRRIIFGETH